MQHKSFLQSMSTKYCLLCRCSSYVGRKGGPQEVSINSKCDNKGHAMHEIGHALGLWHEHSRPDRDNYIRIIWDNIKEEKLMNFGILSSDEFSTPSVEYDLESIMHYGPYAFSTDRGRLQTIHILPQVNLSDCAMDMGQRRDLSYLDKVRANVLYSCASMSIHIPWTQFRCFWLLHFDVMTKYS